MNKIFLILAVLVMAGVIFLLISFSSDSTKNDTGKSYPTITPTPEATPIDPAEIVQVDTTQEGTVLTVNGDTPKQTVTCTKYDRVYVNGSGTTATIKGPCRQIMVNGDANKITADAASEFVFNSTGNQVTYSRFVNGKIPSIVDNGSNDVQKIPYAASAKDANKTKNK